MLFEKYGLIIPLRLDWGVSAQQEEVNIALVWWLKSLANAYEFSHSNILSVKIQRPFEQFLTDIKTTDTSKTLANNLTALHSSR